VDLGRRVIAMKKYPVQRVTKALGISRSNLYQNRRERPKRYHRQDDAEVLEEIRAVAKNRSTYGYHRTTGLLNRERRKNGFSRRNKKKVYRLMKVHGLLLPRGKESIVRVHTGQVFTLQSDLRYCSDILEIRCWNGETVAVTFSLDCHDREAISWVAAARPLVHEDVMDLMDQTVVTRFGPNIGRLPHAIEWLSDNGGQYTAHETVQYGEQWGFRMCTTPAYSPQSNGMAEAFVNTFKRDYVYTHELPDAQTVIRALPDWFRDYNEQAPHSSLKMRSPWEYRKTLNQVSV
jgi:transposase InsO family protein